MIESHIRLLRSPVLIRAADAGQGDLPAAARGGGTAAQADPTSGNAATHAPPVTEADVLAATQQLQERLLEAVAEVESRRQQSLAEMQHAAIELAVAVASHIVHEKINAADFAVEKLVQEVVARLQPSSPLTIRLHPDDVALLGRDADQMSQWAADGQIRVMADPSLGRGDCRADAGDWGVLAKIDRQLADIRQHLLENLDDAQIERRQTSAADRNLRRYPDRRETA